MLMFCVKRVLLLGLITFILNSYSTQPADDKTKLDKIARSYVKLGLTIAQYDSDFVLAYYGPDSLKPARPPSAVFPKDSLLHEIEKLRDELKIIQTTATDTNLNRAGWLSDQLLAYTRRVKIFSGETSSFDVESKELFGVVAPIYPIEYYKGLIAELDKVLPGRGTVQDRVRKITTRFIIPPNKLDTAFKIIIAECKRQTSTYYSLPTEEKLTLEFVKDKPWTGFSWYKGNYRSLIQIK